MIETQHVIVSVSDYVIVRVRLEKIVDSFTV